MVSCLVSQASNSPPSARAPLCSSRFLVRSKLLASPGLTVEIGAGDRESIHTPPPNARRWWQFSKRSGRLVVFDYSATRDANAACAAVCKSLPRVPPSAGSRRAPGRSRRRPRARHRADGRARGPNGAASRPPQSAWVVGARLVRVAAPIRYASSVIEERSIAHQAKSGSIFIIAWQSRGDRNAGPHGPKAVLVIWGSCLAALAVAAPRRRSRSSAPAPRSFESR
jgi:hypothetical protein